MPEPRRILIADGGDILRMCRAEFHVEGYEAAEASDCAALLDLIQSWKPDGVIIDVGMPTGEGWECLEKVLGMQVPVIAVGASSADSERARELGASEALVKPFGPVALVGTVREVFGPPAR